MAEDRAAGRVSSRLVGWNHQNMAVCRDVADAVTAGLNEYLSEHEDQVAPDRELICLEHDGHRGLPAHESAKPTARCIILPNPRVGCGCGHDHGGRLFRGHRFIAHP